MLQQAKSVQDIKYRLLWTMGSYENKRSFLTDSRYEHSVSRSALPAISPLILDFAVRVESLERNILLAVLVERSIHKQPLLLITCTS